MTTNPTTKDLLTEVDELLAKVEKWPKSEDDVVFEVVCRLIEEVERTTRNV